MKKLNPTMLCDFYKVGHVDQYPKGTIVNYQTWTCRASRIAGINSTVFWGLQGFIKDFLMEYFNENFFKVDLEDILDQNRRAIEGGLGIMNPNLDHIIALHELGYLPLEICALPEGTSVPIRVPSFTVANTVPGFAWLGGCLEDLISNETWPSITVATIVREYRSILDAAAIETTGSTDGVDYQAHDFSLRGLHGIFAGEKEGGAHPLFFRGSDNIPAMFYLEKNYSGVMANGGIIGSIPATEHSVECACMPEDLDERAQTLRLLKEIYPKGLFSRVCDTMDFWNFITVTVPSLKEEIMSRDGKFVIRPDSGDPVDIICGTLNGIKDYSEDAETMDELKDYVQEAIMEEFIYDICLDPEEFGPESCQLRVKWFGKYYDMELGNITWNRHDKTYYYHDQYDDYTWDIKEVDVTPEMKGLIEVLFDQFGGYKNHLGYKVLDEHIGAIYGDSITPERAISICQRLKDKGFASTNVVLGVGSYSYTYYTRDTFGQAFKSTYTMTNIDGVITEKMLFKDPKTDDGTKKSQMGMVAVVRSEKTGELECVDGLLALEKTWLKGEDLLVPVFKNGYLLVDQTLEEIRERVK